MGEQERLLTELTRNASLTQLQEYIAEMSTLRGFEGETVKETMLMMVEEIGELAKAIRKQSGMKVDVSKQDLYPELTEEFADVLYMLLSLSNLMGVNLMDALLNKEQKNCKRVWQ